MMLEGKRKGSCLNPENTAFLFPKKWVVWLLNMQNQRISGSNLSMYGPAPTNKRSLEMVKEELL